MTKQSFISKLTGGRPMKKLDYAFTDFVTNEPVYKFLAKDGKFYLANHAWSIFRTEVSYQDGHSK